MSKVIKLLFRKNPEKIHLQFVLYSRSRIILRRGDRTAKEEYLMGGRQLPPLPVALSLLTTFLSGILMLGVPAEMFQRGAQIWLNFVIGVASSIVTCFVFLPVFHKMKSTCLHEYFIHRWVIFRFKIFQKIVKSLTSRNCNNLET